MKPRALLGSILLMHGVISEAQLQAALEHQKQSGKKLGETLIHLDLCSEVDVARALAEQSDLPFVDLQQTPPSPQALRLIPQEVAVQYGLVPVRLEGQRLLVAALNPFDFRVDDVVRSITKMSAVVASTPHSQLRDILARYEDLKFARLPSNVVSEPSYRGGPRPAAAASGVGNELIPASEQVSIVRKVSSLIVDAVRRRARDIYFVPGDDMLRVQARIDGVVHPLTTVPKREAPAVFTRLTALAGIVPGSKPGPQTGEFEVRVDGRSLRFTSSYVGAGDGNVLAIRNANPDAETPTFAELGMEVDHLAAVRGFLRGPEGLLLVAGPVGAGRPTTLFALAGELQAIGAHVFVLENSFERRLRGVGRIETKEMGTQAFSAALEHALQMKPEALVVGDLPDKESVEIACRAASSGQRIVAGSSATDALSAVSRLLDLGVQPALLGSALRSVLSQRLVRRICSKCARETQLSFQLRRVLPPHFESISAGAFRKGRGCAECHQIGTYGRTGVFEHLELDEDFRSLVAQRPLPSELRNEAERRAFRGLEQDAFLKASRGLIPADDILSLGGPIALAYDELSKATSVSPDLTEDEEPMDSAVIETSDLVSWEEVAELANLLED